MRRFQPLAAACLLMLPLAQPALASGGGKAKKGPEGIPFTCSDGRALRVVYGREGPKAKAKLLFDGAAPEVLAPAPAYQGLLFLADAEAGAGLAWATDGIEGTLSERTADAGEREIARCRRVGWSGEAAAEHHAGEHKADDAH